MDKGILFGLMLLLSISMASAYNITGYGEYTITNSGVYEVMNDLCVAGIINVEVNDVEIINPNGYYICDPVDATGFSNLTLRGWNSSQSVTITGSVSGAWGNPAGSLYIYDAVLIGSIVANGGDGGDVGSTGGQVYIYNSQNIGTINANGGGGYYVGGSGGFVSVFNSTTSSVNAYGFSQGSGSGNGGIVNVTISTVGDIDVSVHAGYGGCLDGLGGTINIFNPSTYGTTTVTGCSGDGAVNIFTYVPPCVPNWSCSGYVACVEPALNVSCNAVTDLNTCGDSYSGDYSEFPVQACSYVVPQARGTGSGGGSVPIGITADVVAPVSAPDVGFFAKFWAWITGLFS